MSQTPASYKPAPGLGQHNCEILQGMLGLSDAEMATLQASGVIAEEPPG